LSAPAPKLPKWVLPVVFGTFFVFAVWGLPRLLRMWAGL